MLNLYFIQKLYCLAFSDSNNHFELQNHHDALQGKRGTFKFRFKYEHQTQLSKSLSIRFWDILGFWDIWGYLCNNLLSLDSHVCDLQQRFATAICHFCSLAVLMEMFLLAWFVTAIFCIPATKNCTQLQF